MCNQQESALDLDDVTFCACLVDLLKKLFVFVNRTHKWRWGLHQFSVRNPCYAGCSFRSFGCSSSWPCWSKECGKSQRKQCFCGPWHSEWAWSESWYRYTHYVCYYWLLHNYNSLNLSMRVQSIPKVVRWLLKSGFPILTCIPFRDFFPFFCEDFFRISQNYCYMLNMVLLSCRSLLGVDISTSWEV